MREMRERGDGFRWVQPLLSRNGRKEGNKGVAFGANVIILICHL